MHAVSCACAVRPQYPEMQEGPLLSDASVGSLRLSVCGASMIVLVLVAHSDDETFGGGGAIKRHSDAGDRVVALSLTDGVGSRRASDERDAAAREAGRRREAARKASALLGFTWLNGGDFRDNALDQYPLLDIVQFIEGRVKGLKPDLVYTHHHGDLNVDHRVVFEATMTAFRPQPGASVREIRSFEVPSATGWMGKVSHFNPDTWVDVASVWRAKREAMLAYEQELKPAPHARSLEGIEALARFRGATVGMELAEGFVTERRLL